MAPTITSTADYPKEHLILNLKIRKPIVEKMHRDRINKSIEDLKDLLGPQLHNQQPDSNLEKADILEMTVYLLRRQLQHKTLPSSDDVLQGFSTCAKEDFHFLSKSHGTVLNYFQTQKPSSDEDMPDQALLQFSVLNQHTLSKEKSPANSAPWRPW
ncbi:transcription factor HES-5-like [Alosa sapidissima]|uniref:transcription factor HES-5-like n=1 Tax=Alosa sapidissima TaxID=34773 RepID=UPI001C0976E1|nr:transcription factor HES-5-like [Alosa sapidissima]